MQLSWQVVRLAVDVPSKGAKQVVRFDRGSLRSPTRTSDGRLRVDAHIARSGVQFYRDAEGTRREYRPPEEVFAPEALDSAELSPFTDEHPEPEVTTENAKQFAVGAISGPRRDGDFVAASIGVFDAQVIRKIESGKVELSCGYRCDYDPTPGVTPSGEAYDGIQRNIRINHVALVDAGRAGPQARIRMDAAVQIDNPRSTTMDPAKLQSDLIEALAKLNAAQARLDKLENDIKAATARADKAEGERDANKTRLDAIEKARKDESDGLGARVQARVKLQTIATAVLAEDDVKRLDKMTDREIKVAVVKRVDAIDIGTTHSDDYVEGFYASASSRAVAGAAANADARAAGGAGTAPLDPRLDAEEIAREKFKKDSREAWKTNINPTGN